VQSVLITMQHDAWRFCLTALITPILFAHLSTHWAPHGKALSRRQRHQAEPDRYTGPG
jgi:hypothetical protein